MEGIGHETDTKAEVLDEKVDVPISIPSTEEGAEKEEAELKSVQLSTQAVQPVKPLRARSSNLFRLTDHIAKRVRDMIFTMKKSTALLRHVFSKETEHCKAMLHQMRARPTRGMRSHSLPTLFPEAKAEDARRTSAPDTDVAAKEAVATASVPAFGGWDADFNNTGINGAWSLCFEVLERELKQRLDRAKSILTKTIIPLRRLVTQYTIKYNATLARHTEAAKELKARRMRVEDLRIRAMQALHQCEAERKALGGNEAIAANAGIFERLTGGVTRLVMGTTGLQIMQQEAVTLAQSYTTSLRELNMRTDLAFRKQMPSICLDYKDIGLQLTRTLTAHLNVLSSLSARSNSTVAVMCRAFEKEISTASSVLETHTDKFIGVKISHTNNKSVAYANNLPVTVDQIRSGIFSKSDLRRRAKAAALKKQMDEFACDIIGNSKILTKSQIETILKSLPNSYRTRDWTQVYALQTDGASLERLKKKMKGTRGKLVIMRTSLGDKFGFFTPDPLVNSDAYYGGRECLVFRVLEGAESLQPLQSKQTNIKEEESGKKHSENEKKDKSVTKSSRDKPRGSRIEVWRWSGKNDCMLLCRPNSLTIGGDDPALHLDKYLRDCTSGDCKTFSSPMLSKAKDCVIHDLEGWAEAEI
ncbi:hypothetical protein AAMO2058_001334700 [Amorphochlora amoebiformis]